MNFKSFAKNIVENVGGKENIVFITHCSTRLRLELMDEKKINVKAVEGLEGVVGTTYKSNQFQIIIGANVGDVYQEVNNLIGELKNEHQSTKNVTWYNKILDVITGSITPVIPLICGSGLIAAFLALFVSMGWLDATSNTYNILNTFGNVGLYALPVFLGFSVAKKIDTNPYYGALMGALMLHPNITALSALGEKSVEYFGLPMIIVSYGSSMVPIFLTVFFLKYVNKFLTKIIPEIIRIFIQPMFVLLIVGSVSLMVFGPMGVIVGDFLANIILSINAQAGWLAVGITGILLPWLTITGMHLSLLPVAFIGLASVGYDALLFPAALVHNMAEGGAGLAVALKTKNKKLRTLALNNTFTVLLGISEPILYTIHIPLKKPLFAVSIGGAIGGSFMGLMAVKAIAPGASVLTFGAFIGETFIWACVGAVISFVAAFIAAFIIGFDDSVFNEEKEEIQAPIVSKKIVSAPVSGNIVPLNQLSDEAFAKLGKGIAINPDQGRIYSPISGQIKMLYPTNHSVGIESADGLEILLHIGIDTVNLKGEGFKSFVKCEDMVTKGDLLIEFDRIALIDKGYDLSTVVVVTNADKFLDIIETNQENVKVGEDLLTIL